MRWLSTPHRFGPRGAISGWQPILALALACGCGRIGYDLLAEGGGGGAGGPPDATAEAAGADASGDAEGATDSQTADAPSDVVDAPQESGCATSSQVDYCTGLPPLPAPPVIDGLLDCGPALVPLVPVGWSGASPAPPFPPGNSARLAAAWRTDGLYVFVSVTTPAAIPADTSSPAFYGAGVEVYVDSDALFPAAPSYDNPGAIQLVATAPPNQSTPGMRAEGFRNLTDEGPWASTEFGTFPTATGFVFEGFVTAADLGLAKWVLASSLTIGFDVAVNVSYTTAAMTGAQGHRVGQYFLHVAPAPIGAPSADPRSWCTPILDRP